MKTLNLGEFVVTGLDDAQADLLRGRDAFIKIYAAQNGWDLANLSMQQILEIRRQPGWQKPEASHA